MFQYFRFITICPPVWNALSHKGEYILFRDIRVQERHDVNGHRICPYLAETFPAAQFRDVNDARPCQRKREAAALCPDHAFDMTCNDALE